MQTTIYRPNQIFDIIRKYSIYVNDEFLFHLESGESKTIELPSSKSIIHAKIDWCRSNDYEVKNNENLVVKNNKFLMLLAPIVMFLVIGAYLFYPDVVR